MACCLIGNIISLIEWLGTNFSGIWMLKHSSDENPFENGGSAVRWLFISKTNFSLGLTEHIIFAVWQYDPRLRVMRMEMVLLVKIFYKVWLAMSPAFSLRQMEFWCMYTLTGMTSNLFGVYRWCIIYLTNCGLVTPYGSTLAQIMASCLTAASHYLNQCLPITSWALCHLPKDNSTGNYVKVITIMHLKIITLKSVPHPPGNNELIQVY